MDELTAYAQVVASPMGLLSRAHQAGVEGLLRLGLPKPEARRLHQLGRVYFGASKFSAQQRTARLMPHPLPVVAAIERWARRAESAALAWRVRVHCAQAPAHKVGEVAREVLGTSAQPMEGVRTTRRRCGVWTWSITAPSEVVAEFHAGIPGVEHARGFLSNARVSTVSTNVIVTLDEMDRIVDGDGEEVTLQLTNGATTTGASLVNRVLSEHGYLTLVHPVEGPVNAYRLTRMANDKQRLMAAAMNPVCAWPGCLRGADECQVHHLQAWAGGGNTNAANLASVCAYHNGVNDDDPNAPPRRGRLYRRKDNGQVAWLPPWAR